MNSILPSRILIACGLAAVAFTQVLAVDAPRSWPASEPFTPVTPERIAALPAAERQAWQEYWKESQVLAKTLPPVQTASIAAEAANLRPVNTVPRGGAHTYGLQLDAPASWYASEEARTIADRVVGWQSQSGAWNKGINYLQPMPDRSTKKASFWANGTFDNDATIYELRFLALVSSAPGAAAPRMAAWRASFSKGLHYVLAAQFPNGGWPQVYPLVGGYHDGITYNDDTMLHALGLVRDIALPKPEFAFLSAEVRKDAQERTARGIRCLLATQLKGGDGKLSVWCQQYDALTLQPCAARNFEPPADATLESATIVQFLMQVPNPSREVVAAVDGAIAWFQRTAIRDLVWIREPEKSRGEVVASPGAPLLWSRLYELGTAKPIFGDRDRTIHYALSEISSERRAGYNWYGNWPAAPIETYKTWRKNIRG